jgi:hypothetical protein
MMRRGLTVGLCVLLAACATRPPQQGLGSVPPPPPPGEPAGATGLSADMLRASYGAPAFTRKDGPTQMWRYDGASCKAFFFLQSGAGGLSVNHVETLPHPANAASDPSCLDALKLRAKPVS